MSLAALAASYQWRGSVLSVPLSPVEEPSLPLGTRHFVVVYQFGKVASNSLVSSLSAIKGVVAVQSHFLGLATFYEILALVLDPTRPEYFAQQELGQLVRNVSIDRTIAAVRSRMFPGVIFTLLSLAREPLGWFQSALTQDIDGYLSALREMASHSSPESDEEAIMTALPAVISRIASTLEASGGIDAFLRKSQSEQEVVIRDNYGELDAELMNPFLYRLLQPYEWFSSHFARYVGLDISQLSLVAPHIYRGELGPGARAYVVRYEDLAGSVRVVLDDIDLTEDVQLLRENVSATKALSRAVDEALTAAPLDRLRALSSSSSYAKQFGYEL